MELVKIATGEPITREQIEAEWLAAQPATVMVPQTVSVPHFVDGEDDEGNPIKETVYRDEVVDVEIPNHAEFSLPYDLTGVDLSGFGAVIAEPTEPPATEPGEVVERDGHQKVGGKWRWKWLVRSATGAELADAKAAKWEQAKSIRDQQTDVGCTVLGVGTFDTDLLSRTNIHGAVTAATIASSQSLSFEVPWKLKDNSIIVLDAPTMIGAGMAVMQRTSDCHAHAQGLGIAIEAAADFAALEAIDIETGWPE